MLIGYLVGLKNLVGLKISNSMYTLGGSFYMKIWVSCGDE